MGKCAFFFMWHWFGVVVFQRCIVDWGDVCHGYMCILLYVTLIWCSGVPEMYAWLLGDWERQTEREAMSICLLVKMVKWYLCISQSDTRFHISQYQMQCSGVAVMYAQKVGGSICLQYICAFSYMSNLFGVMVLHAAMVNWGGSICLQYICAFSYMSNLFGVMVLHAAMVDWSGGQSAFSIYVHTLICETYSV